MFKLGPEKVTEINLFTKYRMPQKYLDILNFEIIPC